MRKQLAALAIAALLATSLFMTQGLAESIPTGSIPAGSIPTEAVLTAPIPEDLMITIGTPTQCSGYFFSDMWGNNSVDLDIRTMLHGYSTVVMGIEGEYELDETVVADFAIKNNTGGGRTYTVTLAEGMTYNDGTPITAEDYLFSILLQSDPAIPALDGTNTNFSFVTGYDKYAAAESGVFSGLRLLDENRFSITVPAEMLPYYYELAYVKVTPYPLSAIAPWYRVRDDGKGAYLATENADGTYEQKALSADLLRESLLSVDGYAHQPTITSGPYQLVEYDAASSTVTLEINPMYRGNGDGRKPEIPRVKVIQLLDDEAVDAYIAGEVQVVHRLVTGDAIDRAMDISDASEGRLMGYLRSGYAFVAFACEQEPMDDADVRRALAMCLDRESICVNLANGYALPVNGYYGWGQWMVGRSSDALLKYDDLGFNVNEARKLLEKAGYIYNSEGQRFRSGLGQVRCKEVEKGILKPLEVRWAKTPSVPSDKIEEMLSPIFEELGVRLIIDEVTFAELLEEYYRQGSNVRSHNFYFLSTNFHPTFDPYYTYHTDDAWQGVFNTSGLRSEALMNAAENLRRVEADDVEGYLEKWIEFQDAWHEEVPTAPIYSNVYYDLCIPQLTNYHPSTHVGFSDALLYATYVEEVEEEEELEEEPEEEPEEELAPAQIG